MIVCVPIPKTASSTFHFILENNFGISHCHSFHNRRPVFDKNDFAFARKVFPRMRSISGGNLVNAMELGAPEPFYITFTREPTARVFSHYQHMVRSGSRVPFEEALRTNELLQNLNVRRITGSANLEQAKVFLEKCGFVGLTEKFDLSLRVLSKLSPCPLNLNYKRKQIAPDNAVKKKLENDPRAVEMVREYNKLDLELYSFAANEIFPRSCSNTAVCPSDKIASYEVFTDGYSMRCRLSGFYNKVFRQLCKVRSIVVKDRAS